MAAEVCKGDARQEREERTNDQGSRRKGRRDDDEEQCDREKEDQNCKGETLYHGRYEKN